MKKPNSILLTATLLITQLVVAKQNEIKPNIKNESNIKYSLDDMQVVGATKCRIKSDSLFINMVKRIGISINDLNEELSCTVGDFDGNKYLDFAIWGSEGKNRYQPDYENYLVLFFEKGSIIRELPIKSKWPGSLLLYYSPRTTIGPNNEPKSVNDALWLIGSTGDHDDESKGLVFIYDKKTEGFQTIEFGNK